MVYNFYLKNLMPFNDDWGEGNCYVLGLELKALFDRVCQSPSTSFTSSDFHWDVNSVPDTSLLVYVLPARSDSLVRRIRPRAPLGGGGTTHISTAGNLSEVYVTPTLPDADPIKLLAHLAFHELMHNQLKMGDGLHGHGGAGLASGTVFSNTPITNRNVELMAAALGTTVKQNTSFL